MTDSSSLNPDFCLSPPSASFLVTLEGWGVNLGLFLVPPIAQVRTVFDSLSTLWSELPWCPVCKARLCQHICGPPCCVHLPQGAYHTRPAPLPAWLPDPCHRRLNVATACSSIFYLQRSSRHGPQLVLELECHSGGHSGRPGWS